MNVKSAIPPVFRRLYKVIKKTGTLTTKNNKALSKGMPADLDHFEPFIKVMSTFIIAGGLYAILVKLGLKGATNKINSSLIKDADKYRNALNETHSTKQQRLWDDIRKSQENTDSLIGLVKNSPLNASQSTTNFSYLDIFNVITNSARSRKIQANSKWLSIQLRNYEMSLNHNQLILYKNLYETELKIASKSTIIKSLAYVGIPYILFYMVGKSQAGNIDKWEMAIDNSLKKGGPIARNKKFSDLELSTYIKRRAVERISD
jgi:hypothetical protein